MYVDPNLLMRLDDAFRVELETARDDFFSGLLWSTAIVFLGCLIEGPEVVHAIFRRTSIIWPRTTIFEAGAVYPTIQREGGGKLSWLSFVGWMVLIVGLCGEGVFEALVSKADGTIQTFKQIALGDGLRQAAAANERASANELALVQLKARMQWRVLTREQQKHLFDVLRPMAPQSVRIGVLGTENPEVNEFAESLWTALRTVWISVGFTKLALLSGKDVSISVRPGAPEKATKAAMQLASELNRDGIRSVVVPEADPNALTVLNSLLNLPAESNQSSDILILVGTRTF